MEEELLKNTRNSLRGRYTMNGQGEIVDNFASRSGEIHPLEAMFASIAEMEEEQRKRESINPFDEMEKKVLAAYIDEVTEKMSNAPPGVKVMIPIRRGTTHWTLVSLAGYLKEHAIEHDFATIGFATIGHTLVLIVVVKDEVENVLLARLIKETTEKVTKTAISGGGEVRFVVGGEEVKCLGGLLTHCKEKMVPMVTEVQALLSKVDGSLQSQVVLTVAPSTDSKPCESKSVEPDDDVKNRLAALIKEATEKMSKATPGSQVAIPISTSADLAVRLFMAYLKEHSIAFDFSLVGYMLSMNLTVKGESVPIAKSVDVKKKDDEENGLLARFIKETTEKVTETAILGGGEIGIVLGMDERECLGGLLAYCQEKLPNTVTKAHLIVSNVDGYHLLLVLTVASSSPFSKPCESKSVEPANDVTNRLAAFIKEATDKMSKATPGSQVMLMVPNCTDPAFNLFLAYLREQSIAFHLHFSLVGYTLNLTVKGESTSNPTVVSSPNAEKQQKNLWETGPSSDVDDDDDDEAWWTYATVDQLIGASTIETVTRVTYYITKATKKMSKATPGSKVVMVVHRRDRAFRIFIKFLKEHLVEYEVITVGDTTTLTLVVKKKETFFDCLKRGTIEKVNEAAKSGDSGIVRIVLTNDEAITGMSVKDGEAAIREFVEFCQSMQPEVRVNSHSYGESTIVYIGVMAPLPEKPEAPSREVVNDEKKVEKKREQVENITVKGESTSSPTVVPSPNAEKQQKNPRESGPSSDVDEPEAPYHVEQLEVPHTTVYANCAARGIFNINPGFCGLAETITTTTTTTTPNESKPMMIELIRKKVLQAYIDEATGQIELQFMRGQIPVVIHERHRSIIAPFVSYWKDHGMVCTIPYPEGIKSPISGEVTIPVTIQWPLI